MSLERQRQVGVNNTYNQQNQEHLLQRQKWNKCFSAWNQYVDYFHEKWMKKFGHNVDEEEDGSSEYEESEEDSEE